MERYNKIIKNRLISIITTLIFLISSTYIWFNYKKLDVTYSNYEKKDILVSDNITLSNLQKVSEKDIDKIKSYNLEISNISNDNQDIKITIARDLLGDNISNNYLKYSINGGSIHSLNMDGVIYLDNLKGLETKNIDLKFFISDSYNGDLNYKGRVVVS